MLASLVTSILVAPMLATSLSIPMNWNQPTTTEVAPGGSAWAASPSLPRDARSIRIKIAIGNDPFLTQLATVLPQLSNRNKLLACAAFGSQAYAGDGSGDPYYEPPPERNGFFAAALMRACFALVAALTAPEPTAKAMRANVNPCQALVIRSRFTMSQDATGYLVEPTGAPVTTGRSPLKVRCTVGTTGISLTLKARGKGTLRKALGERLTLGFMSPINSTASVPLTLTYSPPR